MAATDRFRSQDLLLPLLLCVALLSIFAPMEALAGPGGEIVKATFRTGAGRMILLILAIILAPLVLWFSLKWRREVNKTRKDLTSLSRVYPWFEWSLIEQRVRSTAAAIYGEWSSGRLERTAQYLTPEYLQAQYDIFEMWEEEGRRNLVEVKRFGKIVPLLVLAQDWNRPATLYVSIDLTVKDYLVDKMTGKAIKGSNKNFERTHQVFSMVYIDGEWLLHSIEVRDEAFEFASTKNEIFTSATQMDFQRIFSQLPGAHSPDDDPSTEVERPRVGVETDNRYH